MMSLNKIYENIFGMALISLVIAIVIKVSGFNPIFEITILEYTLQSTYHTLWLLIGIYFFYLAKRLKNLLRLLVFWMVEYGYSRDLIVINGNVALD